MALDRYFSLPFLVSRFSSFFFHCKTSLCSFLLFLILLSNVCWFSLSSACFCFFSQILAPSSLLFQPFLTHLSCTFSFRTFPSLPVPSRLILFSCPSFCLSGGGAGGGGVAGGGGAAGCAGWWCAGFCGSVVCVLCMVLAGWCWCWLQQHSLWLWWSASCMADRFANSVVHAWPLGSRIVWPGQRRLLQHKSCIPETQSALPHRDESTQKGGAPGSRFQDLPKGQGQASLILVAPSHPLHFLAFWGLVGVSIQPTKS